LKVWHVAFDPGAEKDLKSLATRDRERVFRFLEERIATSENPRRIGHALTGPLAGLWSYRIGDFRVIAKVEDARIRVLVVRIANRREVYRHR
jgi:mRNA interferase RelE/StbE